MVIETTTLLIMLGGCAWGAYMVGRARANNTEVLGLLAVQQVTLQQVKDELEAFQNDTEIKIDLFKDDMDRWYKEWDDYEESRGKNRYRLSQLPEDERKVVEDYGFDSAKGRYVF